MSLEHTMVTNLPDDLWKLARTDTLTGLGNRLTFNEILEAAFLIGGHTSGAALIYIDLDHFKDVNDTLGHPVGDKLLRAVGDRIAATARDGDACVRLGGDEFAVLAFGADREAARALASRIVSMVERPYLFDGHLVHTAASVGVAMAPDHADNSVDLLKRADLALYKAKEDGRNTFRMFEPEMDDHLQARQEMEADLRTALGFRQFELRYQPLLNIGSNRIDSCEVLLQWRHPVRGVIASADFTPLAEKLRLITSIGEWVLKTACREAAKWPSDMRVAVNVSPVQFGDRKLVGVVKAAIAASGLDPSRLELEITESALMRNTVSTLDILRELRAMGVRIVMDEFGTGYSSLSYLRSFPFDKIKMDHSFLSGIATRRESSAIIRAIVGLGSTLGMATVAEGVETQEQMDWMQSESCTHVQGRHVSKPLTGTDLTTLIDGLRDRAA